MLRSTIIQDSDAVMWSPDLDQQHMTKKEPKGEQDMKTKTQHWSIWIWICVSGRKMKRMGYQMREERPVRLGDDRAADLLPELFFPCIFRSALLLFPFVLLSVKICDWWRHDEDDDSFLSRPYLCLRLQTLSHSQFSIALLSFSLSLPLSRSLSPHALAHSRLLPFLRHHIFFFLWPSHSQLLYGKLLPET